jgi:putative Holliday junction resolvase
MENGSPALDPGTLLPHACWMQRALGIDTGDARIGLALSDELRMLAHPFESVPAGRGALERIVSVVREKTVDTVVVGLPKNMNGTKGPAALKAEAFAESVRALVPEVKIVLWDERLSTVAAQRDLHEAGRYTKQSRAVIDQVAAQLILQGWLDSQAFLAQ